MTTAWRKKARKFFLLCKTVYLYRFTMYMYKQNIQPHHCHRANEFYILLLMVICNYMAVYNMGVTYLTKRLTIPLWFLFITFIYLDKRSGMCPPHVHTKWNFFSLNSILSTGEATLRFLSQSLYLSITSFKVPVYEINLKTIYCTSSVK